MATRKQWFNDIKQQLNTDLTLKGLIEYHEENGEHFYSPFDCSVYVKTALNDKSIDISIAHTEEDLTNNHFFFLILQVDNGKISFIKRFNDHTHLYNLGNYRNPSTEQYIEAVKDVSAEVVYQIMDAIQDTIY